MSKLSMVATTVIGTLLLAGSAFAQSSQSTMPQSSPPTQLTKPGSTPDAIKTAPPEKMEKMQNGVGTSTSNSADQTAGAAKGAADIKTGSLTTDLVGKPVRNLKGDKIGEVERVHGNQAVVAVGGFLGIGERRVALNASELMVSGNGKDAAITTTLTEDELDARPKVDTE